MAKKVNTKTASKSTTKSAKAKTAKKSPKAKATKAKSTKAKSTKAKTASKTKVAKQEAIEVSEDTVTMDRRDSERREQQIPVAADSRKVQRRRQIDPTTCERDYSGHEIEFMRAMDEYKRTSGRMFPTCSEILEVLRDLGYVQLDEFGNAIAPVASADANTPGSDDEESTNSDDSTSDAQLAGCDS